MGEWNCPTLEGTKKRGPQLTLFCRSMFFEQIGCRSTPRGLLRRGALPRQSSPLGPEGSQTVAPSETRASSFRGARAGYQ